MITKEEYLKALQIVENYHKQIRSEALQVMEITIERSYKTLDEIKPGDKVQCFFVHSSSTKHLTFMKEYPVERIDNYRFLITTDSGKKKWYYKSNKHFEALN